MRRALAGGVLMLALASPAGAQALAASVNHRLSPDDAIIVTTKHTGETRGVFVSVSSTSLVLSVKGRQQEIPVADVAAIDKPGDPIWGGAIIGGAILGLGFMGGAGASCSPNCDKEVTVAAVGGAAIGAAIGAGLDYLHRGRTRVYRAPVARPAATASPIAPEPARSTAASLGALWERVKPGNPVSITLTDGRQLDGTFARASESVLALGTDDGVQEFPAGDVRRVVRKTGGNHGTRGLLIGLPLGALFSTGPCYRVDTVMHPDDSGVSCGTAVLLGTAAGGAVGFGLGRTVWRRTAVYEAPATTKRVGVIVAPILSPHRIGVAGTVSVAP